MNPFNPNVQPFNMFIHSRLARDKEDVFKPFKESASGAISSMKALSSPLVLLKNLWKPNSFADALLPINHGKHLVYNAVRPFDEVGNKGSNSQINNAFTALPINMTENEENMAGDNPDSAYFETKSSPDILPHPKDEHGPPHKHDENMVCNAEFLHEIRNEEQQEPAGIIETNNDPNPTVVRNFNRLSNVSEDTSELPPQENEVVHNGGQEYVVIPHTTTNEGIASTKQKTGVNEARESNPQRLDCVPLKSANPLNNSADTMNSQASSASQSTQALKIQDSPIGELQRPNDKKPGAIEEAVVNKKNRKRKSRKRRANPLKNNADRMSNIASSFSGMNEEPVVQQSTTGEMQLSNERIPGPNEQKVGHKKNRKRKPRHKRVNLTAQESPTVAMRNWEDLGKRRQNVFDGMKGSSASHSGKYLE